MNNKFLEFKGLRMSGETENGNHVFTGQRWLVSGKMSVKVKESTFNPYNGFSVNFADEDLKECVSGISIWDRFWGPLSYCLYCWFGDPRGWLHNKASDSKEETFIRLSSVFSNDRTNKSSLA